MNYFMLIVHAAIEPPAIADVAVLACVCVFATVFIAPCMQADWVVKDAPQPQVGNVATAPSERRWVRQPLPRAPGAASSSSDAVPAASSAAWLAPPAQGEEVEV